LFKFFLKYILILYINYNMRLKKFSTIEIIKSKDIISQLTNNQYITIPKKQKVKEKEIGFYVRIELGPHIIQL